jgi:hypothetical protein
MPKNSRPHSRTAQSRRGQSRKGQSRTTPARTVNNRTSPSRAGGSRSASRRSPWRSGVIPVALVIALIVVFVLVKVTSSSPPASNNATGSTPAAPAVVKAVTTLSPTTFDAVGVPAGLTAPQAVTGSPPLLTKDGKPSIVYIGAEYCPFCATERWPLVIALSRFGKFTGLRATHSASGDVYPNTATFSFYGSKYSSQYLSFTSVELESNVVEGNSYRTLQTPTAQEQALFDKYDAAPYTSSPGSIPFLDFGDRFIVNGATYDPQVLQGKSMSEIAHALSDPTTEIAQGAVGTANLLTAAICRLTNDKPDSVCSSAAVRAAMGKVQ